MRAIAPPILKPQLVYQTCIDSISDTNLRDRLNAVANNIVAAALNYEQKAKAKQLYTIPANHCENDDIVLGEVTKQELKSVYSLHMVERSKPARLIYDQLLSLAPLGRCPFCGVGHASTLDHYLPKNKFPQLSVTPLNLVPSCKDCNIGKKFAFAITAERQCLHPYFDHHNFIQEQWLHAKVEQTNPTVVRFFVQAPNHWDNISKERVQSHFNDFNLALRYSIEASNQIACLRDLLLIYWNCSGSIGVKQYLMTEALGYFKQHANSWQNAMFQALAKSDWYCDGGFH